MIEISVENGEFVLKSEYNPLVVDICREAPSRRFRSDKAWVFPNIKQNASYLLEHFKPEHFTPDAAELVRVNYTVKDTPWPASKEDARPWQGTVLDRAYDKKAFGLFWEMRLGKTFVAIQLACQYKKEDRITKLLVVVPNSIKATWAREFGSWATCSYHAATLEAGQTIRLPDKRKLPKGFKMPLQVLVCGVESLSSPGPLRKAFQWVGDDDFMMVVDESTSIKNPRAKRTQNIIGLGEKAKFRMIMTGTPITQGIHDLYSQMEFLDPDIIGMNSWVAFKRRYVIEEHIDLGPGKKFTRIVGYRNVKELLDLVAEHTDHLKTRDVIDDLPERTYEQRWVKPSRDQASAYQQLKSDLEAEYKEEVVTVRNTLEQMTRFQQIAGGFFPGEEKIIPLDNPKLRELENVIETIPDDVSVIIWCKFRAEIAAVAERLRELRYDVVEYHGGLERPQRDANEQAFQSKTVRFFVGNPATGGMGLELSAADYMIYYSNSFSYQDRQQSEARAQHVQKKHSVMYIDLFVDLKCEHTVATALKKKTSIADMVSKGLKGEDLF